LRLNFGSLFANQRTFNRIILLDAGAVSIPQRDSKQKRVSAYRELMNRRMICETPLTLLASDFTNAQAAIVCNKLVSRLALLGRVLEYSKAHGDVPVLQFVEKLNRTNKIDESKVKYSNVQFPPDLTIFTNACNHVNSTDLSVYLRLTVPLDDILAVLATSVTVSSASEEVAPAAAPAETLAPALAEPANADAAAPAAVPVIDAPMHLPQRPLPACPCHRQHRALHHARHSSPHSPSQVALRPSLRFLRGACTITVQACAFPPWC